ncbi:MAG: hemin uptake protein HemP [Rhodospirillales bacterium]|nr:hemin uptake protein HemP [Rhodospirillales bacterium]
MTTETTSPSGVRPAQPPADIRAIDSKVLLAGRQELSILHCGEAYLLRVTKNGKLLLTK